MKQAIILVGVVFSLKCFSQNSADAIIGKWINLSQQNLIIEVFKTYDEYKGKISWTKDNDKRKPVGFVILDKLKYNAKNNLWEHGKVHSPILHEPILQQQK